MRLIDADALLEQYGLRDATKYGNENAEQQHKSYGTLMMYEIADMIYDAPTISPAANWTPCSVALPEGIGMYVVTAQYPSGDRTVYRDMFRPTTGWNTDAYTDKRVIAWKPRSEPYRGEA